MLRRRGGEVRGRAGKLVLRVRRSSGATTPGGRLPFTFAAAPRARDPSGYV